MKGLRWLVAGLVLIGLLIHNLPYVVRDQVVIWLRSNGAETASFKALNIDWFRGRVEIQELVAQHPDKLPLVLNRLLVDLDYGSLLDKRLLITELSIQGLDSGIRIEDQQMLLGTVDLAALTNSGEDQESDQSSVETPTAWQFGIDRLNLDRLNWVADMTPQHYQISVQSGELRRLYFWQKDQPTEVDLTGQLNGSDFSLNTTATPLPENKKSVLALKLDQFPLQSVTAPFLPELKAVVDLDLEVKADLNGEKIEVKPSGRATVSDLSFSQTGLKAKAKEIDWQGAVDIALDKGELQTVSGESQLALAGVSAQQAQQLVALSGAGWKGSFSQAFNDGKPGDLALKGSTDLTGLSLEQGKELKAAVGSGKWQGDIRRAGNGHIALAGTLNLSKVKAKQAAQKLQLEKARWQGKGEVKVPQSGVDLTLNGNLGLSALSVVQPALNASLAKLDWQGKAAYNAAKSSLSVAGDAQLNQAEMKQNGRLGVNLKDLSTDLTLSSSDLKSYDLGISKASLSELVTTALSNQYPLLSFKKLELNQLDIKDNAQRLKLNSADAQALNLGLAGKQKLTSLNRLSIADLALNDLNSLNIGRVSLRGSETQMRLDKTAKPEDIERLQRALATLSAGSSANDDKSAPFKVAIGQLAVDGKNRVSFVDRSTKPVFKSEIDLSKLRLARISNSQDNLSPFELKATFNRLSELDVSGKINLYGGEKNGAWKLNLKGLGLPALSPYALKYSGYYLRSGQLQLSTDSKLVKSQLDGKVSVQIFNLNLEQGDQLKAGEYAEKLSMPLETAVSIIQDDDGNIEMDIPISGNIDDPNFGVQDVINTVLVKGVKNATTFYLLQALQPYGALITLGKMALDASNSVNLEPIQFVPGQNELTADGRAYLNKISALMVERSNLRLNLCGVAVAADKQAMIAALELAPDQLTAEQLQQVEQQLSELAGQRSEKIKTLLLDRVATDRLLLCFPEVSLDKAELKPQVRLGL